MQAYHLDQFGDAARPVLRDCKTPAPGPHQVLVRVRARSLNYRDLLILKNRYPIPSVPGTIALSDGAGEVVALGEGVRRVALGDRVAGTYFQRWIDGRMTLELVSAQFGCTHDGMLAEYVLADEEALVKIPPHLSFAEAACLPCAAVTAWSALTGPRRVLAGETVLTIGTGGVALFALQFARIFGARVISLTSTEEKAELLRRLGAHDVVNYRTTPAWDAKVRELTEGRGADHVVETGGLDTLPKSVNAAGLDSQLSLVIAVTAIASPGDVLDPSVLAGRGTIRRIAVGSRTSFEEMNRAITLHGLRPVIDRTFGFLDALAAYDHFEARKHVGKVVIAD
ncbi:zinc-dependent alcohol dehydrogenase family protein [Andreprevotia chitinilytica]|uniref:zinc-dependent alcohol dehydrogenase family protein n=1 Tax=Andreprevotia chitinilytica TaxID=396808 RepID=UPI00054E9A27|nr:NAD(P)-dependent alcohol dehydrogenase [Andreprevotia chitinilytica]